MLRAIFAAVALLIAMPIVSSARAPDHADLWNGSEIDWRDPRSGIYEASQTGRPVIMLFHATWCSACKRFRAVFKDPSIVEASRDFVMILVDADADKEVNGAFAPDGTYVPRTLFIDSDGNISDQLVGKDPKFPHTIDIESPAELLSLMRRARDVFGMPGSNVAPPASADERT